MEFSVYSFLYLFIVLAPFIIICAITLLSLFNADFKGICFIAGLSLTTFATAILGQFFKDILPQMSVPPDAACKATIMTLNDTNYILPMGQVIISFTFWYFIYCIVTNGFVIANIGMIIFFVLLVIGDIAWNYSNKCFHLVNILLASFIGGSLGTLWAKIIDAISESRLLYFVKGTSNEDTCSASNQKFVCNVTKNGKLLQ